MSEVLTREKARRTVGGYVWFTLVVGGWSLFFALLAFSEPTLRELWRDVRDLPVVLAVRTLEVGG